MVRKAFLIALLLLAPVQVMAAQPRSLADSLIPAYVAASDAKGIGTLMRLQLEAGRWQDAESSAERLTEVYRRTQPERAFSVMPWRIYARARRYQAQGPSWPDALRRAFGELYGSLPDREVARTYGWMGAHMDALQQTLMQAQKQCAEKALDQCDGAADIIAARQSVIVWEHLQPSLPPLLKADTERRFIVDDKLTI